MRKLIPIVFVVLSACGSPPASGGTDIGVDGADRADVGAETPDFLDLRAEEISDVRAVVRFDTSIPTSCEVQFGTAEDTLDRTATDPDMAPGETQIDHEVELEDLEPATEYFWRARVEDANGEEFVSAIQAFRTEPATVGPVPLQNFALAATVADVSSNFGGGTNDSTWGAANAIDGQMSTEWSSQGDGDDAWVEIAFASQRKITHFAFRSRKMTDGTSIITRVQVSFDDGAETIGPFDTPDPDTRYEFELDNAVAASKARVETVESTGGNTGAREIEFLGTPKE